MDKVGIKLYHSFLLFFFYKYQTLILNIDFTAEEYGKNLEASKTIPETFVPQITLD